jgi:hypothetical protein
MLPYDEFHLAELKAEGANQHLRFIFSMHEVIIAGYNLKRVLIAMQKKELAFVAKVSAGYQSLIAEGTPIISGIVVNEKAPPESQKQIPGD